MQKCASCCAFVHHNRVQNEAVSMEMITRTEYSLLRVYFTFRNYHCFSRKRTEFSSIFKGISADFHVENSENVDNTVKYLRKMLQKRTEFSSPTLWHDKFHVFCFDGLDNVKNTLCSFRKFDPAGKRNIFVMGIASRLYR